jgi:hypothetical protein
VLPDEPNGSQCALCGSAETIIRCHVSIAHGFEQARAVCAICEKRSTVWNELKKLPAPEILSTPHLTEWGENHRRVFESIWKMRQKPWENGQLTMLKLLDKPVNQQAFNRWQRQFCSTNYLWARIRSMLVVNCWSVLRAYYGGTPERSPRSGAPLCPTR